MALAAYLENLSPFVALARQVKARRELASLNLGIDEEDARDVLASLTTDDSAGRLASAVTGEWMYLFKPRLAGIVLYVKLIVRNDCVVISFHESVDYLRDHAA